MGRPTLLTPELQESICKEIEAGLSFDDAAKLNGVSQASIIIWRRRGAKGEEPYLSFLQASEKARVKAKSDALKNVRAAMQSNGAPDWRGEAWFLERTYPDQYGQQNVVNIKVEKALSEILDKLKAVLLPDQYEKALMALCGEEMGQIEELVVSEVLRLPEET